MSSTGSTRQDSARPVPAAAAEPDRPPTRACTAVIVSYRSAGCLPRLLADLARSSAEADLRVIVVDNDSNDGSAEIAEAAGAQVIRTGGNLGYAGGLNQAYHQVPPGSAILVLNPDLSLRPGAVSTLLDAVDDQHIGVAVPAVVDEAGRIYPSQRNEPSILRGLVDAALGRRAVHLPAAASEMVWSPQAYLARRTTDWATGAALLIGPRCAEVVGEWDERFFLYSEETDFFRRVREAGFATTFVPEAVAEHAGGGSGSSAELVALMAVNRVRYFEKYHGRVPSAIFRIVVLLHAVARRRDPGHRSALRAVARRSRWAALPHARRAPTS